MARAFLHSIKLANLKLPGFPVLGQRALSLKWPTLLPLAVVIAGFTMVESVSAQERMLRTLSVTGQGTERIAATLAQVSLGVEVEAPTAAAAQQEAARRSEAVVNFLRSQNVERLQTTGISLQPRYNYANDEQRLIGYTASNVVSFRVEVGQSGRILDEAVNVGATRIDGISFTADEDAITAAQRLALREATADAREQADAVFDALGLTAGDIVGIQINGASPPPPMPLMDMRAANFAEAASTTPVVGGEQEVNASVTLQISY